MEEKIPRFYAAWLAKYHGKYHRFKDIAFEVLEDDFSGTYSGVVCFSPCENGILGSVDSVWILTFKNNAVKAYLIKPFLKNIQRIKAAFPELKKCLNDSYTPAESISWYPIPLRFGNSLYVNKKYFKPLVAKYREIIKDCTEFSDEHNSMEGYEVFVCRCLLDCEWKKIVAEVLLEDYNKTQV